MPAFASIRLATLLIAAGCISAPAPAMAQAAGTAPSSATGAEKSPAPAAGRPSVKQTGPDQYEVGGIKFNGATREISVPVVINYKQLPIEYMLVHETGKVHESVLKTAINPSDLQVALLLCHYEPGTEGLAHPDAPKDLSPIKPLPLKTPGANRMKIDVEWQQDGGTKRAPLSEWMLDVNTRKPPPDLDVWIFSGSFVDHDGFAAQAQGSFIAAYLDRAAMINSPAKGNWDDDLWISNPAKIPDEGTLVTLIISPAPPAKQEPPSPNTKSKP